MKPINPKDNKIIVLNNTNKRLINTKIYFKLKTNSNYDGINVIKNLKFGKEHKITKIKNK